MKKKIVILLVLCLTMVMTACGGGNSENGGSTAAPPAASSDATPPASGNAAVGDPVKIVFGNYGSSAMPPYFADQDAINYAQEQSGGSITFEYSADGVLGSEFDMIQQVMDGTIQGVILSSSTFSTYTNLMEVFQLPFLITDYDLEYKALTSDAAQAIYDKVGEDLGVKIVAVQENGIRHFANNVRSIQTLEDMKGLKLRIVPSNMLTEVITNLGASPMTVAYNEVYSALQNKVVDGEEINLTSIYAMKHYEQLDYVSTIGMYPFPSFVVYNLAFWNSLSPEQQEILVAGHTKGSENLFSTYLPEYEEEAVAAIEASGTAINAIEGDARQEFIDVAMPTWDSYRNIDPLIADFIDAVEAMR